MTEKPSGLIMGINRPVAGNQRHARRRGNNRRETVIQGNHTFISHRSARVMPPKPPQQPKKQYTLAAMLKDAARIRAKHGGSRFDTVQPRPRAPSPALAKLQEQIIIHLSKGEASNGDMAKAFGVSRDRVSYATNRLHGNGKLKSRQDRGILIYQLRETDRERQ